MKYKVIVGLGNPGLKYKYTRHNVGFMFIDSMEKDFGLDFHLDKKLKCLIASKVMDDDTKVLFVKPVTYMNNSGECVESVLKYYDIPVEDLIVIHDDLDLPVAKVRIRARGSSGGQKGMQSIIDHTSNLKHRAIIANLSEFPFILKPWESQIRDIGLCMFLSITHNDCLSVKFLIRD